MNDYVKTNVEGLVKDKHSRAVLNVDNKKLAAYRRQKAAFERNSNTEQRVEAVERGLAEIKDLLLQLLSKENK